MVTEITNDTKTLLERAVETWGIDAQMLMLAEECSELATAALHFTRTGRRESSLVDLAEEIADVNIMIAQILQVLDIHGVVAINEACKLNRLADRLKP